MRRKLFFFPFVKMSYFSYAKFGNQHRILLPTGRKNVYIHSTLDWQKEDIVSGGHHSRGREIRKDVMKDLEQKPILHKKKFQELTTDELYELLRVRSEVFVVEQDCVYQDLDGDDQKSIHLWLTVADKVVALARVCPAGTHMKEVSVGIVITTDRGKGYGKQMMLHAIDAAKEHFGAKQIDIEAQEYAKGFYESVGFRQSSDTFMLDGIPHIKMTWTINSVQ